MENEQKLVVKLSTSWDAAPFSSFKDSAYFLQFPWGKNNALAIRHKRMEVGPVDVVEPHLVLVPLPWQNYVG